MTTALHNTTLALRDRLYYIGVPLPFALKRRDPKEPGRRRKEKTEDAIFRAFLYRFRQQKRAIRETITRLAPDRKSLFGYDVDMYMDHLSGMWTDDPFLAKLTRILTGATASGIDIFSELIDLEMDYTLVNEEAAKWASKYAGVLVDQIDKTTISNLRNALDIFIKQPGTTIGDIMTSLGPTYSENRALMIAVTETTNAYSQSELLAGQALQDEYPDVLVIKRWYTNNDDRGCDICGPLHMKVVPLAEEFIHPTTGKGYDGPAAHVRCRCSLSVTTRISGEIGADEYGGRKDSE